MENMYSLKRRRELVQRLKRDLMVAELVTLGVACVAGVVMGSIYFFLVYYLIFTAIGLYSTIRQYRRINEIKHLSVDTSEGRLERDVIKKPRGFQSYHAFHLGDQIKRYWDVLDEFDDVFEGPVRVHHTKKTRIILGIERISE